MGAVDEGSRSEPIEIELTAHAPTRRRRGRRSEGEAAGGLHAPPSAPVDPVEPTGAAVPPGDPVVGVTAPGPFGSAQGRLVATAVAVGLVGLVLGWVLGRSGGDGSVADVSPSSTVARTTTTLLGGDTLPDVDITTAPQTTRPRPTTTTQPEVSVTEVTIDGALASSGRSYRLVGLDSGGRMIEIDTASASVTTTRLLGSSNYDASIFLVGADWVLVPDPSAGAARLFRDGAEPERVDIGDVWQLLRIPGTDLFWRAAATDDQGMVERFEQTDLSGQPTGVAIDVPPVWGWYPDPAGGLATAMYGRTYHVGEDGVTAIGSGDLVALGESVAVLRDCDEQLRCGLFVVDRSNRERRPVGGDVETTAGNMFESVLNWGPARSSPLSPDGRLCAVMVFDRAGPYRLAVLDLESGAVTPLASDPYPATVEWSPDGRFAFFVDRGIPKFWDRATGETAAVATDGIGAQWQSIALRPAG